MSVAILFWLDGLWAFIPRSQHGASDAIERQVISEPESVLGAIQFMGR